MSTPRLEALTKFLEQEPTDAFTHYAIGLEYVSLKRYPEAIGKLQEVIALDLNYVAAYQQLGSLLAQLGRKEESLKILETGIEIGGRLGDTHAQEEMQEIIDALGLE